MKKFTKFTSTVVPVPLRDVDTDLIVPAQFLTTVTKDGLAQALFKRLRDNDPQFSLNQEKFKSAEILVVDSNFGCGSSREHAVWAIVSYGFRVVIAKSFADIFYNNSAKNGLLLVTLNEQVVDKLLKDSETGNCKVEVDLEKQTVVLPDGSEHSLDYNPFRKHCLLNGLEDLDYILSHQEQIDEYRKKNADKKFFSTLEANN